MNKLFLIVLILSFSSCMFHPPSEQSVSDGPYIDSIGYKAFLARMESVERETSDTLIAEALAVQNDTLQTNIQAAFFQSIEDSYQRYLKLFSPVKRTVRPEIHCDYDLVKTFKLLVLDPQPFINAILHTMSLMEVTTVDFIVEPKNTDTTLLYVSFTRLLSQEGTNRVTMSEDDLILSMASHRATLMTPLPGYDSKGEK
jgi:hypothetical protein